jgi:dipeptidase E
MKLLLASGGISNASIRNALIELLGKPIAESTALLIPTAVHAIPGSPHKIRSVIQGAISDPLGDLGWKSLAVLELTALPTLKKEVWLPTLQQTDALLVNGGDCQYLFGWMQRSGLADLLPELIEKIVYVGQSAGSMIMSSYGTTYGHHTLPADTGKCFGFLDFAILPHLDHEMFPNNSMANLEKAAAKIPMPTYVIDDQTALKVTGDRKIEVISEGNWKLFPI